MKDPFSAMYGPSMRYVIEWSSMNRGFSKAHVKFPVKSTLRLPVRGS